MTDALLILAGFATLLVGGDLLVRGSAWLAVAAGVRPMVVGLTVVAFGTSAPELAASVAAVLEGEGDTAIGTVFGSNVANIALIIGTAALVWPIEHVRGSARFEVRCLGATAALLGLPLLLGELPRWYGGLLLAGLVLFTLALLRREMRARRSRSRSGRGAEPDELESEVPRLDEPPTTAGYTVHIGYVLLGLVGLKFGADWLLSGALGVARALGISGGFVGSVLIALGTSLPELAASIAAAKRHHSEIVLGNVLGSNLFNTGMVLGTTAAIEPLALPTTYMSSVLWNLGLTAALAWLLGYRRGVARGAGMALLACYAGFLAWQILNRAS